MYLVLGSVQIDNEMFFEVYDPGGGGVFYGNDLSALMGKDRYYRSEDLFKATKNWWPKAFIIAKKGAAAIE